jgi:hypothetical protein
MAATSELRERAETAREQFPLTRGLVLPLGSASALNAAFLAAKESKPISMSQLILATKAEFQKEGKLCVKTDFSPYYELIQKEGAR